MKTTRDARLLCADLGLWAGGCEYLSCGGQRGRAWHSGTGLISISRTRSNAQNVPRLGAVVPTVKVAALPHTATVAQERLPSTGTTTATPRIADVVQPTDEQDTGQLSNARRATAWWDHASGGDP